MCGYVAHVSLSGNHIDEQSALKWLSDVSHRGPDQKKTYRNAYGTYAHARLSVVGDGTAIQPAISGSDVLVYNGEIYDFETQRDRLGLAAEARFQHSEHYSDTEVLLKGLMKEGADFLKSINGMFSGVWWDPRTEQCVLFRDRFGQKPIYYAPVGDQIFISSEFHALKKQLECMVGPQETSYAAVCEYLELGYVVEPRTWCESVFAVQPGQIIYFGKNGIRKSWFWRPEWLMSEKIDGSADIVDELLTRAIHNHTPKNTSYSLFLSGGIDSSLIMESNKYDQNLRTASVRFNDTPDVDHERAYRLSALYNTPFFESVCVEMDAYATPDLQLRLFKEPFSDLAGIPTAALADACKKHGKVVLGGDGADELFFGYRNHRMIRNETVVKQFLPKWFVRLITAISPFTPSSPRLPKIFRLRRTLESLSENITNAYLKTQCLASPGSGLSLLREPMSYEQWRDRFLSEVFTRVGVTQADLESTFVDDEMKIAQWLDTQIYLPSCVLKKVDRATMHHGVEARSPFLDNALSEYALRCDSKSQISGTLGKKLLRTVAAKRLPSEWSMAPKKSFTPPQYEWMRQYLLINGTVEWESLMINSPWASIMSITNWKSLLSNHASGKSNNGPLIWAVLVLIQSGITPPNVK